MKRRLGPFLLFLLLSACGLVKVEYPSDRKAGSESSATTASGGCADVGCSTSMLGPMEEIQPKIDELDAFNKVACAKMQQYALPDSFALMSSRIKKRTVYQDLSQCANALNGGLMLHGHAEPDTAKSCAVLGQAMAKGGCLFDQDSCVEEMGGFNEAGREAIAQCILDLAKPDAPRVKGKQRCPGFNEVDPSGAPPNQATINHLVGFAMPTWFSQCRRVVVSGNIDGMPQRQPGYWR
jgi:hypothetical protein